MFHIVWISYRTITSFHTLNPVVCSGKDDGDLAFFYTRFLNWLATPRTAIVAYNSGNKGVTCSDGTDQAQTYTTQRPALS